MKPDKRGGGEAGYVRFNLRSTDTYFFVKITVVDSSTLHVVNMFISKLSPLFIPEVLQKVTIR